MKFKILRFKKIDKDSKGVKTFGVFDLQVGNDSENRIILKDLWLKEAKGRKFISSAYKTYEQDGKKNIHHISSLYRTNIQIKYWL